MITLGVLCSGGLGFDTLVKIHKEYQINFILTDKKSIEIIQFSKEQRNPSFYWKSKKWKRLSIHKKYFCGCNNIY